MLEQVLRENRLIRTVPKTGVYKGKSVVVAPVQDEEGGVVAAVGVSDVYGALDFIECFCRNPGVVEDVEKCLIEKRINIK